MGANDLTKLELSVGRWGNSLAVRLPAELARRLGVEEGSALQARVSEAGRLELSPADAGPPAPTREQMVAELEALHRNLPMGRSVVRFMRDQGY